MRRFLALILAAVMSAACKPSVEDIYAALPAEGSPLPDFRYTALSGEVVDESTLRGRPAVVALWSSTCSASRLALEAIGAIHTAYAPRGVGVLVLAEDADRAQVEPLLAQSSVQAPVALASKTLIDTFTHGQSVLPWRKAFALPTFLVVDAQGRVVYRQIGIEAEPSHQLRRLRAQLNTLLDASPSAARTLTP